MAAFHSDLCALGCRREHRLSMEPIVFRGGRPIFGRASLDDGPRELPNEAPPRTANFDPAQLILSHHFEAPDQNTRFECATVKRRCSALYDHAYSRKPPKQTTQHACQHRCVSGYKRNGCGWKIVHGTTRDVGSQLPWLQILFAVCPPSKLLRHDGGFEQR